MADAQRKDMSPPERPPIRDCPPDTVQLFQIPRGPFCPSMSPFPLKVETYLRLAGIPYQNDLFGRMSPQTSKTPWIRYNGADVSDSTLIIDFLNEKCGVDLNRGLTTEQRAVSLAFERLADEHLYWVGVYHRWVSDEGFKMVLLGFGDSDRIKGEARDKLTQQCYMQGMGRHPEATVLEFGEKTLKAMADYLGAKPFMMGDQPTQVDCSLFGILAQVKWQLAGDWPKRMMDKFPNLSKYCDRMKERVWPDWADCITEGGTKQATK